MSDLLQRINEQVVSPDEIQEFIIKLECIESEVDIETAVIRAAEHFSRYSVAISVSINFRMQTLFNMIYSGEFSDLILNLEGKTVKVPKNLCFAAGIESLHYDDNGYFKFRKSDLLNRIPSFSRNKLEGDMQAYKAVN